MAGKHLQVALALLLGSCQGFDPDVFDERLRAATFDHYVAEIDLQLAAERPGLAQGALARRFRERAVAASTPWQFQRVLAELLIALDDPHADLRLSARGWNAADLGSGDRIVVDAEPWPPEVVRAGGSWCIAHRPPATPADGSLGARLVASAGDSGQPLAWWRLRSLDGHPVRNRAECSLLLRGPLLEPVIAEVVGDDGQPRRLELWRTALRATDELQRIVVLPPDWVAQRLCRPQRQVVVTAATGTSVTAAPRPFRAVSVLREARGPGAEGQLDAWRLGATGYLRFGSFATTSADSAAAFRRNVADVMARLADCDVLVVDLLGNHGGAWDAVCGAASYFLPKSEPSIPHEGRRRQLAGFWPLTIVEDVTTVFPRDDVPELRAGKVVVLVDQHTASAAEILAAVLRCRRSATIVGERTAGAETWVHAVPGPDGSAIEFGLPGGMTAGEHFQGRGLEPDVVVEMSLAELREHGVAGAFARLHHAIRAAGLRAAGIDPQPVLEPLPGSQ